MVVVVRAAVALATMVVVVVIWVVAALCTCRVGSDAHMCLGGNNSWLPVVHGKPVVLSRRVRQFALWMVPVPLMAQHSAAGDDGDDSGSGSGSGAGRVCPTAAARAVSRVAGPGLSWAIVRESARRRLCMCCDSGGHSSSGSIRPGAVWYRRYVGCSQPCASVTVRPDAAVLVLALADSTDARCAADADEDCAGEQAECVHVGFEA